MIALKKSCKEFTNLRPVFNRLWPEYRRELKTKSPKVFGPYVIKF